MLQKKLTHFYKKVLPIVFLGIFSFFINYHYGFLGVMPMDNFVLYNGGYKVLNGYIPFNDYWLVTGPLLDYLNAAFFYVNGLSWKSYIIHSSFVNLLLSIFSYILFLRLGLNKYFSIFYSALISVLFYPVVGTPFVDHHSTFFSLICFYFFILGVALKNYNYFFFIPLFFCFSFLSKQTPALYSLFVLIFLNISYFIFCDLKKKFFIIYFYGSILALIFLYIFFYLTKIDYLNFLKQYIYFASTIGDYRISTIEFKFFDILEQYKFINILILILILVLVNSFYKEKKNLSDFFVILTSILIGFVFIFHQHITFNQEFIFFLIPFLSGIIHLFCLKYFNKNFLIFIVLLICIFSTIKYHLRFNEHRKFNELEKVNLNNFVDAEYLSPTLKGLKWITDMYPNNPKQELDALKQVLEILKIDSSNKSLITDYQILAPILGIYDYSPNQWHHASVSFPTENQKYFSDYKFFFIQRLKDNKIENIYETITGAELIVPLILNKNCYQSKKITNILIKHVLKTECSDFK